MPKMNRSMNMNIIEKFTEAKFAGDEFLGDEFPGDEFTGEKFTGEKFTKDASKLSFATFSAIILSALKSLPWTRSK